MEDALKVSLESGASGALAEEVQAFWARQQVNPPDREARLAGLVATARDAQGQIQAVATAPAVRMPGLNNTLQYRYRFLVDPAWRGTDVARRMLDAFAHAAPARSCDAGQPVGIVTDMADDQLDGPTPLARGQAGDLPFYYMGQSGGLRGRVAWFPGARLSDEQDVSQFDPMRPLPDGYRLQSVADGLTEAQAGQIMAIWQTLTGLTTNQMRERLAEVRVLTLTPEGAICGVLTAYREYVPTLGATLHAVRAIMTPDHRKLNAPAWMAARFLEDLQARFDAGEVIDSLGVLMVVQSDTLLVHRNEAVWPVTDAALIGMSPEGYHLRACYVRGAPIPAPRRP